MTPSGVEHDAVMKGPATFDEKGAPIAVKFAESIMSRR
jgi:hypothetical protein